MTCRQIQTRLADYSALRLAVSEADAIRSHLTTCVACARFLQEEGALAGALERLPMVEPASDGWAAVAARLDAPESSPARGWLARLRPASRPALRRPLAPLVAGAALAVGVLTFGYERAAFHQATPTTVAMVTPALATPSSPAADGLEIITPSSEVTEIDDPLRPQMDSLFAAVDRATQKSRRD